MIYNQQIYRYLYIHIFIFYLLHGGGGGGGRRQIVTYKDDSRTEIIKIFILDVDP